MDNPVVSVVMNSRNGARYIRSSVESVISQTYKHWELIFFDNNSTDETESVISSYADSRIKYFKSNSTLSLGEARSAAWDLINGKYVAVLDSDDLWFPDKITKQLQLIEKSGSAICISNTLFFSKKNKEVLYKRNPL